MSTQWEYEISTCQLRLEIFAFDIFIPFLQLYLTMTMGGFFPLPVSALFFAVVLFLGLTLLLLLCVIKKRMEGTYRPSAEEKKPSRAGGSEQNGLPFPLPKEERLIWFTPHSVATSPLTPLSTVWMNTPHTYHLWWLSILKLSSWHIRHFFSPLLIHLLGETGHQICHQFGSMTKRNLNWTWLCIWIEVCSFLLHSALFSLYKYTDKLCIMLMKDADWHWR